MTRLQPSRLVRLLNYKCTLLYLVSAFSFQFSAFQFFSFLSQSTWWSWLQACSAMADFSSSPILVAALCSLMRVSRALFMYIHGRSYMGLSIRRWTLILLQWQPPSALSRCWLRRQTTPNCSLKKPPHPPCRRRKECCSDLEPRPTDDKCCVELHPPTMMSSGIRRGRSEAEVKAEAKLKSKQKRSSSIFCFEVDSV